MTPVGGDYSRNGGAVTSGECRMGIASVEIPVTRGTRLAVSREFACVSVPLSPLFGLKSKIPNPKFPNSRFSFCVDKGRSVLYITAFPMGRSFRLPQPRMDVG